MSLPWLPESSVNGNGQSRISSRLVLFLDVLELPLFVAQHRPSVFQVFLLHYPEVVQLLETNTFFFFVLSQG